MLTVDYGNVFPLKTVDNVDKNVDNVGKIMENGNIVIIMWITLWRMCIICG